MDTDRDAASTADEPAQRGIVRSVKSAAALLGCFRDGRTELRLSDLAREVGLNVSTAHRLLRTLADSGLLAQDPHNDRYRPGPMLIEISRSVTVADRTASTIDVLSAIAIRSGESVSLGTRSGSDAVVVMHVASPNPLRFERKVGQQVPLQTSALGKALLAFGAEPVDDAVNGLDGSQSKSAKRTLIAELKKARDRGYTTSVEEEFDGICSVAAPVISADGSASVVLELAGPVSRVSSERMAEFARILAGGAGAIEHDPEAGYLV